MVFDFLLNQSENLKSSQLSRKQNAEKNIEDGIKLKEKLVSQKKVIGLII